MVPGRFPSPGMGESGRLTCGKLRSIDREHREKVAAGQRHLKSQVPTGTAEGKARRRQAVLRRTVRRALLGLEGHRRGGPFGLDQIASASGPRYSGWPMRATDHTCVVEQFLLVELGGWTVDRAAGRRRSRRCRRSVRLPAWETGLRSGAAAPADSAARNGLSAAGNSAMWAARERPATTRPRVPPAVLRLRRARAELR